MSPQKVADPEATGRRMRREWWGGKRNQSDHLHHRAPERETRPGTESISKRTAEIWSGRDIWQKSSGGTGSGITGRQEKLEVMGKGSEREDTAGTDRDRKTERGTEQEPEAGRENLKRATDTAVARRGRPRHHGKRKETTAWGRGAPGAGSASTLVLKKCLKKGEGTPERCGTPDRGRVPAENAVTHTPMMMQVPLQQGCVFGVLEVLVAVQTSGGGLI